jgi:molybdopterin-guanine dinucleotide biosynthesis protein A
MRTGGIVLCGGRSSRMGRPKAWLPFGNELMLQRVVRVLREVVDPVVVVAAPGQDVPDLPPDVHIVRDEVEGKGPLGGLAAGLAALEGKAHAAYLSSCDVPLLKPEFVRRIVDEFTDCQCSTAACDIVAPRGGGFFHPLAAVYSLSLLPHVHELLAADRLRPLYLITRGPTLIIEADKLAAVDPALASLRNLNTPEDYEAALRELDQCRPG